MENIGIANHAAIYLTQAEMDAISFFQETTMSANEAADDESFHASYEQHNPKYYSVHEKFKKARKKAAEKALVKRVLKDIEANK